MLVQKLETQGVHLETDGTNITVNTSAPLTDEQRKFLKLHKPELITELKGYAANVIDLIPFLKNCCVGYNTNPEEVKKRLLSSVDIEDIISGEYNARLVKSHIEVWVIEGKQDYLK
ncbi:MAG: hypothetical protein KZQ83_17720 [gamma proteobacterium symbiont of Taylorina sp.]|nr:hypothetical protein [gamma proteobacterium symbiont of Taylorina sp.]